MSNTWYMYLITLLPNMNAITTLFSKMSLQTLKMYEKVAIITQNFQCASAAPWHLIKVPYMKKIHQAIMEECARTPGKHIT